MFIILKNNILIYWNSIIQHICIQAFVIEDQYLGNPALMSSSIPHSSVPL